MRRLDLHPKRKLRNPGRHLRALSRWPETIAEGLPAAELVAGQRYWNFKVPVFAKLVEPPHATPDMQRACLAAIFAAADAIEHAESRPARCRVACLVTTPLMFESEVTLFPDEDYFRSFAPVKTTSRTDHDGGWIKVSPADPTAIAAILPDAPAGLAFLGGTQLVEVDHERGDEHVERFNWVWAYPRR